jgi:hypothetical protein
MYDGFVVNYLLRTFDDFILNHLLSMDVVFIVCFYLLNICSITKKFIEEIQNLQNLGSLFQEIKIIKFTIL